MAFFARAALAALVALGFCGAASAEDITGAGSTFVFQAAAAGAAWTQAQDSYLVMTDASAEAYPIAATAFILMHKDSRNLTHTTTALDFFRWALESGQKQAMDLDYVALPPSLVGQIEAYWKSVMPQKRQFLVLAETTMRRRHDSL